MNKGVLAILGIAAAVIAGPAAAQDNGLYFGGQAGRSQFEEICQVRVGVCNDRDWAFRVFGGYQFNKYLGLEAAYADLGEARISGSAAGAPVDTKAGTYGFDLLGVVTIPLGQRFSLIGKGGAYRMRSTIEDKVAGTQQGSSSSGFAFGIGLGYDIGKLGVRADFLRYDNIGGPGVAEDSVGFYTLGLIFRFY